MTIPSVGDIVAGKYRVDRVLGEGGMGIVVAATHLTLRQLVAVKFLIGDLSAVARARFLREGRAAAQIQNEHVVRVSDVAELEDGTPFMVMEHLSGQNLHELLDARGALPMAEAVDLLLQASEAVAEAHAVGIVHRDLKPSNLFLAERRDGSKLVKVLDFGISKEMDPVEGSLTATAQSIGSPYYMSPEQVRSAKNVDRRADVWALGVILYELLTKRVPFGGQTLGQVHAAIVSDPFVFEKGERPDVPAELEAVVARCLEKSPSARFASVGELARALLPFSPGSAQSAQRIFVLEANAVSVLALAETAESKPSLALAGASATTVPEARPAVPAESRPVVTNEPPAGSKTASAWGTVSKPDAPPAPPTPRRGQRAAWGTGAAFVVACAVGVGWSVMRARDRAAPAVTAPTSDSIAPLPPSPPAAPAVASTAAATAPAPPTSAPASSSPAPASSPSARAPVNAPPPPRAPMPAPSISAKPSGSALNAAYEDRK